MIKDKKEVKKTFKEVFFHNFVIGTFVALYAIVSIISTIHVIAFFELSNPYWLAVSLAIAFEIGAAASLSSIIILGKVDKRLVWFLFILLTGMQAMGNTYYAFTNLENYKEWIDLFGLNEMEVLAQKRILSIVSGAILPIVALGFIKSLVDYMKPSTDVPIDNSPVKAEEPKELIEETPTEIKLEVEESKPLVFKKVEPDVKEEVKPEVKEEVKPEVKEEVKPEVKDEVKLEVKEEVKPEVKEEVKPEVKEEVKPEDASNFEKELDTLKGQLEQEKKKTKFEKELDAIRDQIADEKDKNKALKVKREKDIEDKRKLKEEEDKLEEKKKEKIAKEIKKDLNPNAKVVKEIKVKPVVKRNPNPTRPL